MSHVVKIFFYLVAASPRESLLIIRFSLHRLPHSMKIGNLPCNWSFLDDHLYPQRLNRSDPQ